MSVVPRQVRRSHAAGTRYVVLSRLRAQAGQRQEEQEEVKHERSCSCCIMFIVPVVM